MHAIIVSMQCGFRCSGGPGGDEDGYDRGCVTGLVKVFQIERVIPNLVERGAVKRFFADLELNHKDDPANQQHGIDSTAHAGDVEFKKNASGEVF